MSNHVFIASRICNKEYLCKDLGINTESINFKFFYCIKKFYFQMSSSKNINDLLVNLNPKVLRFTGEKFPSELWNTSSVKNDKDIATK